MRVLAAFEYIGDIAPQVRMTDKVRRAMRSRWGWENIPEVARYLAYKAAIGYAALEARNAQRIDAPVARPVAVWVTFATVAGWEKRWDVANAYKAVEDGMSGVVYVDDTQVVRMTAEVTRRYAGEMDRTLVEVWEL